MILAEVKRNNGDDWETRLFNISLEQFRKLSNRRFVAINRTTEISIDAVIKVLRRMIGWDKEK